MSLKPNFFYSTTKDECIFDGYTLVAANNTANGDLCAYIQNGTQAPLIWACPAPDSACWSFNRTCAGKDSTTPGTNQILCNNGGSDRWCCNSDYEECTQLAGQINVCIAKTFQNPNDGVPPAAASSIASSLMAASATSALQSRLSAIAATASTSKSGSASSSHPASAVASSSKPNHKSGAQEHVSGGAIAGIVIAGIIVIALLVAAVFLFLRRRRAHKHQPIPSGSPSNEVHEAGGYPVAHRSEKNVSNSGLKDPHSRHGSSEPIELSEQTIPIELPAERYG